MIVSIQAREHMHGFEAYIPGGFLRVLRRVQKEWTSQISSNSP